MKNIGSYPSTRLRRNRKKEWSRRLVQESSLSSNDLIWPIFISEGKNLKEEIEFHNRIRASYLKLANDNSDRIKVIDSSQSPDKVQAKVIEIISKLF